ncbi:ATP-binding cassette domain-containing protein [Alteromonas sp. BL110]|uniref:ATP-binding cassette domain-containing protein n=1 Tax=Alteromonas sp. BL110 TaxID=1714845 RepID=UPI000E53428A|nr:ATP-binding cassette domain-containing protein [Alteromonas sp. BL110]AXT38789.1 ATP-binding cassette domain-containing protein [Alteromonas sp. BL110]RKM83063.1 ATP-binding cassette domain-containing protein [Alteromonas sp. BL110]
MDSAHTLGLRRSLMSQVAVKCLSLFSLIIGFYYFSCIAQDWVVNESPAAQNDLVGLSVCLGITWLLQGAVNRLSQQAKSTVLHKLEIQLKKIFVIRQHALVRQNSVYYWQSLWLQHLQAFTDWALEYRVQQAIAVVVPLLALSVLFYVNPVIGFGLLITLPVVPLFMIIVGKGAAALHRKHFGALERLGSLFTDRLTALPMLANFQAHQRQTVLLKEASKHLNNRTMKVVSVAFLSNSVLDFFATLAVALVAVFIGFSLLRELEIGPAITLQQGLWILLTVPLLLSEMKKLGQVYHQKAQAEAAQEELAPLYKNMPSTVSLQCRAQCADNPEEMSRLLDASNFNVFDLREPALLNEGRVQPALLKADSLIISKGDKVLLNGKSGAGKTLLLEALSGQRPATHKFEQLVLWITQHPVITPGTVRENLCLNDTYSDDILMTALRDVELEAWLTLLPYGLDTVMTDYPQLSGGEAQRLSLARALLRDESIWLLDEPTAHLPDEQHHRLAQLIKRLGESKTLIWASHKALPCNWFNQFWSVEKKTPLNQANNEVNNAHSDTGIEHGNHDCDVASVVKVVSNAVNKNLNDQKGSFSFE